MFHTFAHATKTFAMMIGPILIISLAVGFVISFSSWWRMKKKVHDLKIADRMQKAFLQNISHEIRVPLKVFQHLANTISKEDLYLSKNEKRNISDQLVYNSDLITTLLDEVMMFAGIHQKGHKLWLESFSPNALCRRCLEANQQSIYHRQNVKLSFRRELSEEFFVKSDRHLVELIINKLVINACKFTEEGEITVGCNTTEHPDCVTLYVSDTGRGIPESRMDNLFNYFEDNDHLDNEAELDLSICQKLAELLKGQLLVDENYHKGTRMKVVLPLR